MGFIKNFFKKSSIILFFSLLMIIIPLVNAEEATINIIHPGENEEIKGNYTLQFNFSAPATHIFLSLNDKELFNQDTNTRTFEYFLDTGQFQDGTYGLSMRAYIAGQEIIKTIQVKIANSVPLDTSESENLKGEAIAVLNKKADAGFFSNIFVKGGVVIIVLMALVNIYLFAQKSKKRKTQHVKLLNLNKKARKEEDIYETKKTEPSNEEQAMAEPKLNKEEKTTKAKVDMKEIERLLEADEGIKYTNPKFDNTKPVDQPTIVVDNIKTNKTIDLVGFDDIFETKLPNIKRKDAANDFLIIDFENKPQDQPILTHEFGEDHFSNLIERQELKNKKSKGRKKILKNVSEQDFTDDSLIRLKVYIDELKKHRIQNELIIDRLAEKGWPRDIIDRFM